MFIGSWERWNYFQTEVVHPKHTVSVCVYPGESCYESTRLCTAAFKTNVKLKCVCVCLHARMCLYLTCKAVFVNRKKNMSGQGKDWRCRQRRKPPCLFEYLTNISQIFNSLISFNKQACITNNQYPVILSDSDSWTRKGVLSHGL